MSRLEDQTRASSILHRKDALDAVWAAAFGAAYAHDVARLEALSEAVGKCGNYDTPLDFARAGADVERAMTIANDAVRRMREWIEDNGDPLDEAPTPSNVKGD